MWPQLKVHTIVVQGMEDKLVSPANIDDLDTVLKPDQGRIVRLDTAGHLFPMILCKRGACLGQLFAGMDSER